MNFPDFETEEEKVIYNVEDVDFETEDNPLLSPDISYWIEKMIEREGKKLGGVSYIFCSDNYLHKMNLEYLKHDTLTDVITFPFSGKGAKKLEGELVLGVEVAQREAADRGHDVHTELCLYVIHGLLHLCGYDDKTARDSAAMRRKEREYLQKLDLPDIADE